VLPYGTSPQPPREHRACDFHRPRRTKEGHVQEISRASTPRSSPWSACAFVDDLYPLSFPSSEGPSSCTRLSRAPAPMPNLTACGTLECRLSLLHPTLHPPSHSLQALPCSWHRTQSRMLEVACFSLCPFHALWLPRYCTWGKNRLPPVLSSRRGASLLWSLLVLHGVAIAMYPADIASKGGQGCASP